MWGVYSLLWDTVYIYIYIYIYIYLNIKTKYLQINIKMQINTYFYIIVQYIIAHYSTYFASEGLWHHSLGYLLLKE